MRRSLDKSCTMGPDPPACLLLSRDILYLLLFVYFQVNAGVWYCLDDDEDIYNNGSPLSPFSILNPNPMYLLLPLAILYLLISSQK